MWRAPLLWRWIIHCLLWFIYFLCSARYAERAKWQSKSMLPPPLHMHTFSRRAHSSLHYTALSRTLTWMHARSHMHNNTNTLVLVPICAPVPLPYCIHLWLSAVWLGAVSNHADFTSCVSAVHRDLFALLSTWKLSCRKSSLFQSTPLRQIIIKPELRSLRMYAEKMKRTIRTVEGYFHGCRWCYNCRIQFRGKHKEHNERLW